ncbi:hypothetical protein Scep_006450 [Stephania cephalantha]|uniref:Nodulin-like domain-containing protein n=1 Tax=Stephania cephalantha TaxID=152367 RepID=A0AAP0K9Q6_9MAGN
MRNFEKNRGPVSGILKGYVGLTTTIFTDLCSALFSNSPSSFLLMLAIVPAVVIAVVVFLREVPETAAAACAQDGQVSHASVSDWSGYRLATGAITSSHLMTGVRTAALVQRRASKETGAGAHGRAASGNERDGALIVATVGEPPLHRRRADGRLAARRAEVARPCGETTSSGTVHQDADEEQ